MHPLTRSVTREEAIQLLDLTPQMLEAMLASGAVLCQLRNGEPQIPLQQLEAYFRDRLMQVYRAESAASLSAEERPRAAEERTAASEEQPRSTEEQPSPPEEQARSAEEPSDASEEPARPRPAAAPADDDLGDVPPDFRMAPRYVPRRQIDGFFDETKFTIVQISATGLRIRHADSLFPGSEAKLTFALLNPARSVMLRARVVWTSVAQESGSERTFWISGLRVTQHPERLAQAIDSLRSTHDLQPDRRATPRPAGIDATTPEGVSDEEIALVVRATSRFAADPMEASRWYGRGRFALADAEVRRVAPRKPREREEVLAVWEFLDRRVDVEKVTAILSWARKARPRFVASAT